jgi:ABC-type antimicrobial peptide transport system permease subunit
MPQRIRGAVIVVRTMAAAPTVLSGTLRRTVALTDSAFRVSTVNTQVALIQRQTVRERLLANLGVFFAGVALLLAARGLYGVVNYSVMRREREIGIRIAMGAQARTIMWLVTARVCFVVLLGAMEGLLVALGSARYIEVLLYGVNASDPYLLMLPTAILLTSALLAVRPVVRRAVTIAPAVLLRAE